jgi:hypothetical protein
MGLPKGTTNNKNGRPKGTPNRSTKELKQFVFNLLEQNQETIERDFNEATPSKRLQYFIQLLGYVLPKPQSYDVRAEFYQLEMMLSRTPEQFIEKIAEKISVLSEQSKTYENENDE